ncbi:hypothetical protein [Anabaena azotica]|nr:hypothetical protein [Anabaena azotica]
MIGYKSPTCQNQSGGVVHHGFGAALHNLQMKLDFDSNFCQE